MLIHFVRLGVIAALVTICAVLPFLPGRYDGLAVPLAAMAQMFGWAGLLLVPIGIAWLSYESLASRPCRGRYRYEMSGDAYNVFFEHFSPRIGTIEIVMYNPLDQHVMTSHASDLLTRSPQELELRRGYYEVHDATHPHWKYFLFD